ncbi:MAG: hypothetical protein EXR64_06330, partial [Dehalococcoidia bacterium]|nr:hypothetical protein [Dehalococcoidia bacterium]
MNVAHTVWHPGTAGPQPALVAIHGHGAHAQDLLELATFIAAGRLLMICPQAEFLVQPGVLGYTWFQRDGEAPRSSAEFERVAARLHAFIAEAVPHYGGDPARVALLGFSQGGTLAYRLGLAEPRRFAGVAALSTSLPDEAVEHADAAHVGDLPLLVQHGVADPLVAIERSHAARDRLIALGAAPQYLEYQMQHEISPYSL